MNREQTATVVAYLNRANLIPALEGQTAVWHDVLADIDYDTAQEVARGMARTRTSAERWVTPADVLAGAHSLRADRVTAFLAVNDAPLPPHTLAEQPELERAWTGRFWDSIRDGLTPDEALSNADDAVRVAIGGSAA